SAARTRADRGGAAEADRQPVEPVGRDGAVGRDARRGDPRVAAGRDVARSAGIAREAGARDPRPGRSRNREQLRQGRRVVSQQPDGAPSPRDEHALRRTEGEGRADARAELRGRVDGDGRVDGGGGAAPGPAGNARLDEDRMTAADRKVRLHAVAVAGFGGRRVALGYRDDDQRALAGAGHAADDGREVGVADDLLAVGVLDDGAVDDVERLAIEGAADLLAAALHGVTAGVLAEHQAGGGADVLRAHDLVGAPILEHAVLVDAGLVREGVAADDRLVRLHAFTGQRGQQLTGAEDLARVDAVGERQPIAAHVDRHHDFLERGVAGALADAVDRALDLPRARADRRQRVGDGEAEIVMAVRAEGDLVRARDALDNRAEELGDLVGRRVADGVGEIDGL